MAKCYMVMSEDNLLPDVTETYALFVLAVHSLIKT